MGGSGQHVTPLADPTHYRTSSQMISSVVGALPASKDHHTYGVPTIRCDRPAPRIRRVGDSTVSGSTTHVLDTGLATDPNFSSACGGVSTYFCYAPHADEKLELAA